MNNELYHYGTPHVGNIPHSGRYEYGTGEKYRQGSYMQKMDFLSRYDAYKREGMSESQIANAFGMSVNEFRKQRSIANAEADAARKTRVARLVKKGYSNVKIAELMGTTESNIRNWRKTLDNTRKDKLESITNKIEERVLKDGIIDVGAGTEISLGITSTSLNTALKDLADKGYVIGTIPIQQPNDPSKTTTIKYIAPPGTTSKDVWDKRGEIGTLTEYSPNHGLSFNEVQEPTSVDLKRVAIVYKEDGGEERDGMIGIRRGVDDLTLGNSSYAQVRIAVDNKYYIKGMAIYDDNVPNGADIVVYSNKSKEAGYEKALKKIDREENPDPLNPFGATITAAGQTYYESKDGKFIQTEPGIYKKNGKSIDGKTYDLSPINKLKGSGDWDASNKSLSSQFLSKQPLKLIQQQLDLTFKNKMDEYKDIHNLNNDMVRQKLLNDFAENCDKAAKDLDAAALPRQSTKVLIPVPQLKDTEVYAPTYKNGEKLVLIRYPHGGTFEIPTLVVNNRQADAKNLLGNAVDAIGINKKVADRLSGADFDGDFVVAIPVNDRVKVSTRSPLEGLKNFDPKEAYPGYPGMKVMSSKQKGIQMGIVSNLITDMTLHNPTDDELARAVRHSMVVIDAEKHKLNWKQSEKDNGIDALKQKYQKNPDKKKGYGGASSLISRAGATVRMPELMLVNKEGKPTYTADPETGKKLLGPSNNKYKNNKGEWVPRIKEYEMMDITSDARTLSNGSVKEEAYANYANKLKKLANDSRKEALSIKTTKRDPIAAKTYESEVASLSNQLELALKNKPLERQAQLRASVRISTLKEEHPDYFTDSVKKSKLKKEKNKILNESRLEVGAGKRQVQVSDREWEAIQAHAISGSKLRDILNNADMDMIRKLATPHDTTSITSAKEARIKALSNSGFTIAEIAEQIGISTSTVSKTLNGK